MRTPLAVGVVGLDERGLSYANALADLPQVTLRWLCNDGDELRNHNVHRFMHARVTHDPDTLLGDESLDAVVVASEANPALVWRALAADKHVLTCAPLTTSACEAHDLAGVAQARGRALVVSEPLVAQPAAERLKDLIETGLGDVYALYANRQGLPRERPSETGVWAFGADEISRVLYLLEDEPIEVHAQSESYLDPDVADVVFCHLRFATGICAHLHLSWLDPLPTRRVTAIGSKRMAVLDDLEADRKLTIYQQTARRGFDPVVSEIRTPRIEPDDPVRVDCERLVSAARGRRRDPASRRAVAVVEVLETVNACIEQARPAGSDRRKHDRWPDLNVVPLRPA